MCVYKEAVDSFIEGRISSMHTLQDYVCYNEIVHGESQHCVITSVINIYRIVFGKAMYFRMTLLDNE